MPNWCWNDVVIKCKTKKDRDILYREFKDVENDDGLQNGFGNLWLGNLLYHIGYKKEEIYNGSICVCRGDITYITMDNNREIQLGMETAWNPLFKVISLFCDYYTTGYDIQFISEEPGCGIYLTNRQDTRGKYRFDIWDDKAYDRLDLDPDSECELYSEKEVKQMLKPPLGYRPNDKVSLDNLIWASQELFGDFSINKYEFCSIDELE